jgi:signal transduction histidine kinase/ActR/RegA family two-component response regulator
MTLPPNDALDEESLSRAYYDIAHLLESSEDAEARVIRVLVRLRALVPYERCAVLEVLPGRAPHLTTLPGTAPAERAWLLTRTTALLGRLSEQPEPPSTLPSEPVLHIAVPLVSMDAVAGVLLVEDAGGAYAERHVRRLSVVAAKLAAYFCLLRASVLAAERMRQLADARQVAETANQAKDEFLALVSHELRTPLNTIIVSADALRSSATAGADRLRAFDAIVRSVRAEVRLIDDLLDLSCIANATLRLDLRTLEPASLIQGALRALRPRAEQKSIRLEAKLDESVTPLVGDPRRLSQVVANLVANAIKFTPVGGKVEVHLERAGTSARIRVIDTGSGIRPEILPNLFERFRIADSSSTRPHGGLGVGLALVKDLVELHGGRVRAESPGEMQGATFTVDLPLPEVPTMLTTPLATPERRRGPDRRTPRIPFSAQGPEDDRTLAGIRVLLVDDDRDICEVLQFVLEDQGAVVSIAASAVDALLAIERSMPDVLLSDLAMPGQTGYDLMRKIVARKGKSAPPAAALSAYARGQDLREALASGFQMLLSKPIDTAALINAVRDLALSKPMPGNDILQVSRKSGQA